MRGSRSTSSRRRGERAGSRRSAGFRPGATISRAGDRGIQIFVAGAGWNRLEVLDPDGQKIFDVSGSTSVGMTGVTELFFESAEPSFRDLPLQQLLARFREGSSPREGATLKPVPVVIDWDPVTDAFPGTNVPVTVVGYQVIVERVKPGPLLAFSVSLPATATQVTLPAEFIQANADYKVEVLAIEQSGNQTITESSFKTAP